MTTERAGNVASAARRLSELVSQRTSSDSDYWDFAHLRARSGAHALFQYPAMMVPELQGALLDDLRTVQPETQLIYDPFMGSGTVMLESAARGLDFHGSDINPLAVLLSHVKSEPPDEQTALGLIIETLSTVASMKQPPVFLFQNSTKWFTAKVANDLTKIRVAIQSRPELSERRYLWICLAETVRLVSNSRTSTFKLHVYDAEVLGKREPDTLRTFENIGRANARHVGEHWARMRARTDQEATKGRSAVTLLRGSVSEPWSAPRLADAIMTSPPYGDNRTTVPYGQHSYLPLCWLDPADMVGTFPAELLSSTARIDWLSLGGSIRSADLRKNELFEISPSLKGFIAELGDKPPLTKKVLAFAHDYANALEAVSDRLRPDGFSFWTLGQRRVDDLEMPLVAVTQEILESCGHRYVHTVHRKLLLGRKRMAGRNRRTSTMGTEQVLIMQKANE